MIDDRLTRAIAAIDRANSEDTHLESWEGGEFQKELLYSRRMSHWLEKLAPDASDALQLAARAQHIGRWRVPREEYPAGREGYLRWRTFLYRFHADQAESILREAGYDDETVSRVRRIIGKQGLKRDHEVQLIEDVACLVFLEHYFARFAAQHAEDKLVEIVRKTWKKMSERGRNAALAIELPESLSAIVEKALSATECP